eukprot:gene16531-7954_t
MAYTTVLLLFGIPLLISEAAVINPRKNDIEICNKQLDLMLVVDSSGSIADVWNHTIDFCEKLLSNFNIADDQVRVGLIEFSMVANALIPLDSGNNLGRLYQSLEELRSRPQNGETHTDLALNLAYRVFLASKRAEPVPKVLVLITDGELTSGKYEELNQILGDLASLNVEIFVVAQGDDLVEDGIKKMASQPLNDHRFSLTPNSLNVPYATQSLATSICNVKAQTQNNTNATKSDAKVTESTTIIKVENKAGLQQQQQPAKETQTSSNVELKPQEQTSYQEGAWHQNLQQPVGNPKQTYPENPPPQPLPNLPVSNKDFSIGKETGANQYTQDHVSSQKVAKPAHQCSVNLTKVGCYRDLGQVPRPLPIKVLEEKENNFHVGIRSSSFDKQAWENFLPEFICKCAKKTREMKFWTFSIQNYNECYSGPDEGRYDEDGDAEPSKCKDEMGNNCEKNSNFCSGEANTNFVYTVLSDSHVSIVRIE